MLEIKFVLRWVLVPEVGFCQHFESLWGLSLNFDIVIWLRNRFVCITDQVFQLIFFLEKPLMPILDPLERRWIVCLSMQQSSSGCLHTLIARLCCTLSFNSQASKWVVFMEQPCLLSIFQHLLDDTLASHYLAQVMCGALGRCQNDKVVELLLLVGGVSVFYWAHIEWTDTEVAWLV